MHVLPVPLHLLTAISALRITIPDDLRTPEARQGTLKALQVQRCHHPCLFRDFKYCQGLQRMGA